MALEINLHFLPLTELFAEVFCRSNETQVFQFRRVQFVRHRLNIVGYLGGMLS